MSIILQGSTSGSITLQEPAVAGTTVLTLPAVSGTILTTASSGQSIPKAALPTGSVLQVVNASTDGGASNNTSTPADTGLTLSITPTSATSKILVLVSQNGLAKNNNSYMFINLLRNGSNISVIEGAAGYTGEGTSNYVGGTSLSYLDSPATTSAVTYKTQFYSVSGIASVVCQTNSSVSTITLMEIAA
jgi:hypothetical protein